MAGSITIFGVDIWAQDGGEGEPIQIGEVSDAFAGNSRNSVRGEKRNFSIVSAPTNQTTWDGLKAAIALSVSGTVSGLLMGGDSVTMRVRASAKAIPGGIESGDPLWTISASGIAVEPS